MEEKEIIAHVVDAETGEIIDHLHSGDNVKHTTTNNKDEVHYTSSFRQGDNFVKLYDDVVPELRKHLTPSEIIFAISLAPYAAYNDCILRKTGHGNSKVLDAKDISELLNMDYSVTRRLISSLKKKGVMGQHETGSINKDIDTRLKKVYTINPYIYFRGTTINDTIKEFYSDTGWANIISNQ